MKKMAKRERNLWKAATIQKGKKNEDRLSHGF